MLMKQWKAVMVWFCALLLLWAMAGPATGTDTSSAAHAPRIHPYLERLAREQPATWVDVIVLKQGQFSDSDIARAVGAKPKKSWPFLNAMHLVVPAGLLEDLASLPGVAYVSPDSPMRATTTLDAGTTTAHFPATLNVQPYWNGGFAGSGVGVAVIDSGVAPHADLLGRVVNMTLSSVGDWQDANGHGTHVAGIVAGSGADGQHLGMAPGATIYNLRVSDANGSTTESKVVSALEWVYNNHQANNIRVVNISLQSGVAASYQTSPLAGAVEKLWFAGVVVVTSAGNRGPIAEAGYFPPANDPYVITVGALDDAGTKLWADDLPVSWSSVGVTQEGVAKPEVLAPGRAILSTLAPGSTLASQYPHLVSGDYIRLSGSSMAAPVVAGAVALMLGRNPSLSPDQVKHLLVTYGRTMGTGRVPDLGQIEAAIGGNPAGVPSANQNLTPSPYADPGTSFEALQNVYYENVYYENVYYENVYFEH